MCVSVCLCVCVLPVEDGPHPGAVGTVPVDVEAGGQQDAVLHGDGAVGEGGDQQLVPAYPPTRGAGGTRSSANR